jgi:hypothetical protein
MVPLAQPAGRGTVPAPMSPDEFRNFFKQEVAQTVKLVTDLGLPKD